MAGPARKAEKTALGPATVTLDEDNKAVLISNLLVQEAEVYDYLSRGVASDYTGLIVRALRVGAVALRDAVTASKVDYVQREFAALKHAFAQNIAEHFGPKGDITTLIEEKFGEDGEVQTKLAEFLGADGEFEKLLDRFLGEEGTVQALLGDDGAFQERLEQYFGPRGTLRQRLDETFGEQGGQLYNLLSHTNQRGPVGAFMRELNRMFNPDVEDSPLFKMRAEIRGNFGQLYKDFGAALGKAEEKAKGTGKGGDFQDWVFDALQQSAAITGDAVEEVGERKGVTRKSGDVLVTLNGDETQGVEHRIIFEAKNEAISLRGKDTIFHELDRGIQNRKAAFAVAVIHPDHAKDEITPFVYRAPNMIVCTANEKDSLPLEVAYRLARTLILTRTSSEKIGLDKETVDTVVTKIRAKLTEFTAIYTQITKTRGDMDNIATSLRGISTAILDELDDLLAKAAAK